MTTLVLDRFPGSGSDLLAMLLLADWCNDDGGSLYPSIAFVAAKMRVSESQARRVLHGLIEKGYVVVVGNEFGGPPGATRDYQLNVAKLCKLPVLPKILQHYERTNTRRKRLRIDDALGRTGHATTRNDDTPSTHATPRAHTHDGSHGRAEGLASMHATGRIDASQTSNNHQVTIREALHKQNDRMTQASGGTSGRQISVEQLVVEGVSREHAIDWLATRAAKRMPLTPSAWAATKIEAVKAGLSIAEAVQRAAESGWGNFTAKFVDGSRARSVGKSRTNDWRASDKAALARAIEVAVGPAYPHESRDAWHVRIQAAIDNGGTPPKPRTLPVPPMEPVPVQEAAARNRMPEEARAALRDLVKRNGVPKHLGARAAHDSGPV